MLRRRGTYTVNAESDIRHGLTKASEPTTVVSKKIGTFDFLSKI